jgi:hypothetical protein
MKEGEGGRGGCGIARVVGVDAEAAFFIDFGKG